MNEAFGDNPIRMLEHITLKDYLKTTAENGASCAGVSHGAGADGPCWDWRTFRECGWHHSHERF
jgi:hypothetical protein